MPSKKIQASTKTTASRPVAKKTAPSGRNGAGAATGSTFRLKIDLANLAVGARTLKQLSRAVSKLAQTLAKMEEAGGVALEIPVTAKGANLATQDAKLARRFGMEEGRAPRAAKTAAPAAKSAVAAAEAPAAAKKAATKKAAAKKASAKTAAPNGVDGSAVPVAKNGAARKAPARKAPAKKAAAGKAVRKSAAGSQAASQDTAAAAGTSAAE